MPARVRAAAVLGVPAFPVLVEADLQSGLPASSTVGLPDEAVRESRERVRAAIMILAPRPRDPAPAARSRRGDDRLRGADAILSREFHALRCHEPV